MNSIVFFAAFGGLAIKLLQLVEYAHQPEIERPDFGDPVFWSPFLIYPLLGGVLASAYQGSGVQLNSILSLNIGLSAPLMFRAAIEARQSLAGGIDAGTGA